MIRINLLPIKQARRRSQGRVQLILFAGLILLEVAVLFAAYALVNEKLEEQKKVVAALEADVKAIESEVAGAEQLEAEAAQLAEQLGVLSRLEARRSGPVRMLDEIQAILSPPRNAEERVSQLRRDWNVEWDSRRLWVERFSEKEGTFELTGFAGNADDVAEFLQRMTTAAHFDDVQLDFVARSGRGQDLVQFRIYGDLSYTGFDGRDDSETDT